MHHIKPDAVTGDDEIATFALPWRTLGSSPLGISFADPAIIYGCLKRPGRLEAQWNLRLKAAM